MKFSLTLNRLHKVLERIVNLRSTALAQFDELLATTYEVRPCDLQGTFSVDALVEENSLKLNQVVSSLENYTRTISSLKAVLIAKNVELGVNSKVSEMEAVSKIIKSIEHSLRMASFRGGKVKDSKEVEVSVNSFLARKEDLLVTEKGMETFLDKSFTVDLMDKKKFEDLEKYIKVSKLVVDRLHDEISNLNGSVIEIDLPEDIAKEVGLTV